jgi:hypothetical protein
MGIVTLANAKEFVRISHTAEDTTLAIVLDAAEEWVMDYCGTTFGATRSQYEELDGTGEESLWPSILPLASVTEIEDLWNSNSLIAADLYTSNSHRIELKDGARWDYGVRRYAVTYTGGYIASTIPSIIQLAVLQLFARWYKNRATQSSDNSGGTSANWVDIAGSDITNMLDPFVLGSSKGGIF